MELGLISALAALTAGLVFFAVPPVEGLGTLARIAFFHIPTAWVSVLAFCQSAWHAARYLRTHDMTADAYAASAARLGLLFVVLATVSGAIFSRLTWGAYWNWDPRQTTIFVLLLLYGAYLTLRAAMTDAVRRARVSAVYSLFSFLTVPFLVFIVPRLFFSLHPEPILNARGTVEMEPIMVGTLALAVLTGTLLYRRLLRAAVRRMQKETEDGYES